MCTVSDATLVQMAQGGSKAAVCELIGRYEQKTYNLAYRLMGNHADASDAAQEALVRVYTHLHHFRGDSAFSTWLFRVATNTCLDELRRRGRLHHVSLDTPVAADESLLPRQATTPEEGPDERAERQEIKAAVQRAIQRLPEEYRTVVVLRDLNDYSYNEIADLLGTSVGTVKSRLHRARQALRMVLKATEATRLELGQTAV